MDKSSLGPRKVLRAPALRRGREIIPITDRVKLERVLGFTLSSNAAFDCDPNTSIVAYPAGCVIVVYNVRKNKQGHILSSSKKTITSLAFSCDGKYLATGECGHQPHVRVWDVQEKCQVAEFQGHKYGVNCVAFSPNLKYVVSVGSQHDMIVNVWDWKSNVKVASNKVSCKVKSLSFSSNGNYFVTVGNRHVKFWYLEYSRSAKYKLEPVPLMGRSAILGDQRNNYFCDVACGKGEMTESTYAITKSGLLCEFNSRRLLDKWVELRTTSANSISVGETYIFIGCAAGVIRCFNPYNLNFICTLPKPHYLGVDVARGLVGSKQFTPHPSNMKYPDTITVALDEINKKVSCMYNDHSFYVWDIKDMKKIGKSHSFLYHSACIWGIEAYPDLPEDYKSVLPKGTFLTCSSDDTIRFWNLDPNLSQDTIYHRNIYSSELLKVLYIDSDLSYLCDVDFNPSGSNDKVDTTYDGKNGVRCLRISPNGKHLASGDRSGNIRIHDLEFVEELCKIEAHDSEVLCLEYSKPVTVSGEEKEYLASASRDRLIHVFDVKEDYSFQQTLDDHSSSITAVRFVQNSDMLQMISCGADKSIIFRKAQFNPQLCLVREHHVVGKTTLYDMEVDIQQRHILTACQDRNIRVYSVVNGKQGRCFRGSQGEDGTLIKVVLDSSGSYLATSCTDKSLYIYDYFSGECLASMFGHSELVTGLKFTNDGQHLISVSGDGCIFVWRLPIEVTQTVLSKQIPLDNVLPSLWQDGKKSAVAITKPLQLLENNVSASINNGDLVNANNTENSTENHNTPLGYRFSMGQLPLWAKKQMLDEVPTSSAPNQKLAPPIPPRGRWAQRIDGQGLVVRSYLDSDAVIPFPSVSGHILENVNEDSKDEKMEFETKEILDSKPATEQVYFESSEQSFREILSENFTEDSSGRVTLRRGIDSLHSLSNRRENRLQQIASITNNSSIRLEDVDAEDERSDSEVSEMVYYPVSEDGSEIGDSSFHVCANKDNIIKDPQKTSSKPRPEKLYTDSSALNTTEQTEINSDDDEASTPVDSDRSFLSSLCISTENLERLGQREKFMKSNYESLEKEETSDTHDELDDRHFYRQSISAKFLSGSLASNARSFVNGVSKTPQPVERKISNSSSSRREELNKALNEAKRKLETVGYRSGLSSSKSIGDLHSLHGRDDEHSGRKMKFGSPSGDIRRATSMTDLTGSSNFRKRLFSSSGTSKKKDAAVSEPSAPLWNQSNITSRESPVPRPKTPSSNTFSPPFPLSARCKSQNENGKEGSCEASENSNLISRSISMVSLNSGNLTPTPFSKMPSSFALNRTSSLVSQSSDDHSSTFTSSLCNSHSSPLRKNNLPSLPSRTQPLNIATSVPYVTGSSSDSSPTETVPKTTSLLQTGVRTRFNKSDSRSNINQRRLMQNSNQSMQHWKLKSRSEWDLKEALSSTPNQDNLPNSPKKYLEKMNHKLPEVAAYENTAKSVSAENVAHSASTFSAADPCSVQLTRELCEDISNDLQKITSFAMQIFQRVTLNTDLSAEQKCEMSNILAQGIWQAQQTMRPAVPPMYTSASGFDRHAMSHRRLPGLKSLPNGDTPESLQRLGHLHPEAIDTMALLQQFSDKLLSIVEQQISKSSQEKPNN